jgi:hypothetical protein
MALIDGDASWRDLEMGASSAHGVQWDTLTGLIDLPRIGPENTAPTRLRDTSVPGWADIGWRSIEAVNARASSDEAMVDIVAAMADRQTVAPFYFRRDALLPDEDLCVYAVADRCEFGEDASVYANRAYAPSLRWLAADPTIYAGTAEVLESDAPASSHEFEFENVGRMSSPSGRAWTLTITASGTVSSPSVTLAETSQTVTWQGLNLTSGQTLVLSSSRTSRIGSLRVDGFCRSGTSIAPDWPIHQPGVNTFTVAATSGSFTCELTCRSTW